VELWLWGIQLSARSISTLVFVVIVNRESRGMRMNR